MLKYDKQEWFVRLVEIGLTVAMAGKFGPLPPIKILADAMLIPPDFLPDDVQEAAEDYTLYCIGILRGGDAIPGCANARMPGWLRRYEDAIEQLKRQVSDA
jgi:hypothetical protein